MNDTAPKRVVGIARGGSPGEAPVVLLKAAGDEAAMLLAQARLRHDLPVVRDPQLVEQLYRVPLDKPVGRELFAVMASLLAHVLRVDQSDKPASQPEGPS